MWPEVIKNYIGGGDSGSVIIKVGGTNEGILDDVIKVVISDPTDTINQEDWFGGDSGYISDTTGLISDSGSVIIKHEVPKNGDDQYDAADDLMGRIILKVGGEGLDHEWHVKEEKQIDIGGDDIGIIPVLWKDVPWYFGGEGGYISGNDHFDAATEYGGRTSEDISEGDLPLDPTSWIVGHTSTFKEKDLGVRGHTNSFSGDWGT
jgi:hypothetical protein